MNTLNRSVSTTILAGLVAAVLAVSLGVFAFVAFPNNQGATSATQVNSTETTSASQAVPGITLLWDFGSVEYYTLAGYGCPPPLGTYPVGCRLVPMGTSGNISWSAGPYIGFSANVTNIDPKGTIVLYPATELEICPVGPTSQSLTTSMESVTRTHLPSNTTDAAISQTTANSTRSGQTSGSQGGTSPVCGPYQWLLGNVTKDVVAPLTKGVIMPYGQVVTLYFVESVGGIPGPSSTFNPIYLLAQGTICEPNNPDCSTPYAITMPVGRVSWSQRP